MKERLEMAQAGVLGIARTLRKEGKRTEALLHLRAALRRNELDAEQVEQAGRFIAKELESLPRQQASASVLLMGQFTTSWLVGPLSALAWRNDIELTVEVGQDDNVGQGP